MRAALLIALLVLAGCGREPDAGNTPMDSGVVLTGSYDRLEGEPDDLARYRGDVVLVVNTASQCGYTPQFAGLQELYASRKQQGFTILGFPADDVAGQEPRSDEQIKDFCERNFGVEFPMFKKVAAEGEDAIPLFKALGEPDWNFNKYLLDRRGRLVERWGAGTEPDDPELLEAIDAQLRS